MLVYDSKKSVNKVSFQAKNVGKLRLTVNAPDFVLDSRKMGKYVRVRLIGDSRSRFPVVVELSYRLGRLIGLVSLHRTDKCHLLAPVSTGESTRRSLAYPRSQQITSRLIEIIDLQSI